MMSLSTDHLIHPHAAQPSALPLSVPLSLNLASSLALAVTQRTAFQSNMESGNDYKDDKHYVYAVGTIQAYFPNLSIEKEFYQACLLSGVDVSLLDSVNDDVSLAQLNSNAALNGLLYKGLGKQENSYVAREMNWTFSNIDNNEIYTLVPISDEKLIQFVAALGRADPQMIMVGQWMDDGRILVSNLIPAKATQLTQMVESEKKNEPAFSELVDEILSLSTNDGFQPSERGLNYLLYNNTQIYTESYSLCYNVNQNGPNPSGYQLVNVEPFTYWSGKRLISKTVFHYQGINTGARQSWYSAVDVTGEYPFLLTKWKRFLPQH